MQNAGFSALRLDWRYLAFEVRPNDLRAAIDGAKAMGFVGLNLTVPHKLLAMEMVNVAEDAARTWGAVNTVLFEGRDEQGIWRPVTEFAQTPTEIRSHGFNTDADALTRSLREDLGVEVSGARVMLLGAGGAGRTAALKMASDGVKDLYLVNRTAAKAEQLRIEIQERYPKVTVQAEYPDEPVDLAINATSLGLGVGDPLPFNAKCFSLQKAAAVYDMIYRPAETPFLNLAKRAGCRTANGLGMLLYQGARALEIWTSRTAPIQAMREALHQWTLKPSP